MTKTNLILIGIIIILAGVIVFRQPTDNIQVVEDIVVPTEIEKEVSPDEFTFAGEGEEVLGPMTLAEGLVLVSAQNQSGVNSVFTVNVYADANGNGTYEELEGYTGAYMSAGYEKAEVFDGDMTFKSNGGDYFVEVSGGRWQISVNPLAKLAEPAQAPETFTGSNYDVTEKFYITKGSHTFKVTNEGEGNFIILMVDENGNFTSRLINEIGDFEGEFTVDVVFDGNYVFAITGGNSWSIEKVE